MTASGLVAIALAAATLTAGVSLGSRPAMLPSSERVPGPAALAYELPASAAAQFAERWPLKDQTRLSEFAPLPPRSRSRAQWRRLALIAGVSAAACLVFVILLQPGSKQHG